MNENLSTEILKEIKAAACKWRIAFFIMLGLEVITLLSFFFGQGVM